MSAVRIWDACSGTIRPSSLRRERELSTGYACRDVTFSEAVFSTNHMKDIKALQNECVNIIVGTDVYINVVLYTPVQEHQGRFYFTIQYELET